MREIMYRIRKEVKKQKKHVSLWRYKKLFKVQLRRRHAVVMLVIVRFTLWDSANPVSTPSLWWSFAANVAVVFPLWTFDLRWQVDQFAFQLKYKWSKWWLIVNAFSTLRLHMVMWKLTEAESSLFGGNLNMNDSLKIGEFVLRTTRVFLDFRLFPPNSNTNFT